MPANPQTGQISGPMLKSNLERNGINLSVDDNLLYVDVVNSRIGINNSSPTCALDLTGTVNISDELSVNSVIVGDITFNNNYISSTSDLNLSTVNLSDKVIVQGNMSISDSLTITNDINFSGQLIGPAQIVIDPDVHGTNSGQILLSGDVTITGTTTVIESTNVEFADKNILIGTHNLDSSAADGSGLTISLGTDGQATLLYRSIDDTFVFNKNLVIAGGETIIDGDLAVIDLTISGSLFGPSIMNIDPETHGDNTGLVNIVGSMAVLGSNTTVNELSSGNITTSGYLRGPSTFTIDPAAYGDNTGLVNINGSLTVTGQNTTINNLSVNNIATTGSMVTPSSFTIAPALVGTDPGTLSVTGNIISTGDYVEVAGMLKGPAVFTIDPLTYGDNTGIVNILGDLLVAGANTTVNELSSGNITTSGYLRGPATFTIDPMVYGDNTGLVDILGNLQVSGANTSLNDLSVNEINASGNLNTGFEFYISPNNLGTVIVDGSFVVTGDTVEFAGNLLTGPDFIIAPADNGPNAGMVEIEGDFQVNGTTTTVDELFSGTITTTGSLRGPASFQIDPAPYGSSQGLLTIAGDLTVYGQNTRLIKLEVADITTTGTLYGPAAFTIDPATHGDNTGVVTIAGALVSASDFTVNGSTTINDLASGNIITTGSLQGPASFVIDPATHGDNTGIVTIAGDMTVAGSNTTVNELSSGNITTSGYLRGPSTFTIDPAAYGNDTGTVIIAGDLQVNGDTISNTNLEVENLTITGYLRGPAVMTIDPATHGDNTGSVVVAGTMTVAGSNTTVNELSSGNITTSGYLRGPSTFTIDPATHGNDTGTVVIAGNLQVNGTTTTINSTIVEIEDKNITLAKGSSDKNAANGGGITIDLGSDGEATITYESVSDKFRLNKELFVPKSLRVSGNDSQDGIVIKGSGVGTSGYDVTLQSVTLSSNRQVTLPNADVELVAGKMIPDVRTLAINTSNGLTGGATKNLQANQSWNLSLTGQALAFNNLSTTGFVTRSASNTIITRELEIDGIGLSLINADGVLGNPKITSNATSSNTNNAVVSRNSSGNFSANTITATLSGNASTATQLQTARNINGVSFSGTNDITITANTPNTLSRGSFLTGNNFNGSSATTWAVDATSGNVVNKIVARDSSGNFSANTITATLSGNASTATKLQTARTINGQNFDGTANISITAVNPSLLSRGSFLTGSSYNGSSATTWAVDATSANTANKVVARNGSGNFAAGTITATLSSTSDLVPTANNTYNVGSTTNKWNTVYASTFTGTATTAKYADLAENYIADNVYEPGTVLVFGGEYDVTTTTIHCNRKVAGVVSTDPAYLMDSELEGKYIVALALQGKVPCKVIGPVEKGDTLVTSMYPGVAIASSDPKVGTIIGKSLENKITTGIEIITVVVGKH